MKIKQFAALLVSCVLAFSAVSCSDDNDNVPDVVSDDKALSGEDKALSGDEKSGEGKALSGDDKTGDDDCDPDAKENSEAFKAFEDKYKSVCANMMYDDNDDMCYYFLAFEEIGVCLDEAAAAIDEMLNDVNPGVYDNYFDFLLKDSGLAYANCMKGKIENRMEKGESKELLNSLKNDCEKQIECGDINDDQYIMSLETRDEQVSACILEGYLSIKGYMSFYPKCATEYYNDTVNYNLCSSALTCGERAAEDDKCTSYFEWGTCLQKKYSSMNGDDDE